MEKKKSFAFGKEVYLLGKDEDGIYYWLEAPKWDCEWYWGFGYIETYTNNENPAKSRDITSHQHADNFMGWVMSWNSTEPILTETVTTEKENWELCELFQRFYLFKNLARYYHLGGCNMASSKTLGDKKDKEKEDEINQKVLPEIMDRIIEILSTKQ